MMLLFFKGLLIGIGKIIPGVSGAMLAINFKVYEKAIEAVTNFFSDWKNNFKFLLILGLGILLSIIFGSKVVLYLLSNYKFLTLMFFIGLIIGGTYNFGCNIKFNKKNIVGIIIPFLILLGISLFNINNSYIINNSFLDNMMFFIAGFIEIFSSIVPGISGTSLLMILGMYTNVLKLISNIFDYNYVNDNLLLYFSYGVGMFISFIITTYIINYLLKNLKDITYAVILGLSMASIFFLLLITFQNSYSIIEFIIGIMLLVLGLLISCIMDK